MKTLKIKDASDVVAFAYRAIGFIPHESIVFISLGSGSARTFVARVDIPDNETEERATYQEIQKALSNNDHGTLFVIIVCDSNFNTTVLQEFFNDSRPLLVAGGTVYDFMHDAEFPFSPHTHPMIMDWVVNEGGYLADTREQALGLLDPDVGLQQAVADVAEPVVLGPAATLSWLWHPSWEPQDVRNFMHTVEDPNLRDLVTVGLTLQTARQLQPTFITLCRAWSTQQSPVVPAMAGLIFWLCGNGPLAYGAVDLSRRAGGCTLTDLVESVLKNAIPPDAWEKMKEGADD